MSPRGRGRRATGDGARTVKVRGVSPALHDRLWDHALAERVSLSEACRRLLASHPAIESK